MPLKQKEALLGMATVKRYAPAINYPYEERESYSAEPIVQECPEGQWIKLEDFHLVVDQRDAAISNLEKISRWTQTLVHEIRKVL